MTSLLQIGLANALCAAVLAAAALAAGRWSRRPALAHSLWLLVLVKLVTPPLFTWPLAWLPAAPAPGPAPAPPAEAAYEYRVVADPRPASAAAGRAGAAVASAWTPPAPQPSWTDRLAAWGPTALGLLWLAGTIVCLGRAAWHIAAFQRLLRHGRPAPEDVRQRALVLAERLGLRRCPEVLLLPGAVPPLVWAAVGRARVCLPADLLARLDPEQRDALLAHELAHVRRRDHWVRWAELAAVCLYWWYPLAWWARRRLQAHEEECCDAWVAAELPPRAYATAILETLDFLSGAAVPVLGSALAARVDALKRRLTLILTGAAPTRLGRLGWVLVASTAVLLLPLAPVLARARRPAEPPPARAAAERDAEWLRRVYLDVAGRPPTDAELREFLEDRNPDRRQRLLEKLLRGQPAPPGGHAVDVDVADVLAGDMVVNLSGAEDGEVIERKPFLYVRRLKDAELDAAKAAKVARALTYSADGRFLLVEEHVQNRVVVHMLPIEPGQRPGMPAQAVIVGKWSEREAPGDVHFWDANGIRQAQPVLMPPATAGTAPQGTTAVYRVMPVTPPRAAGMGGNGTGTRTGAGVGAAPVPPPPVELRMRRADDATPPARQEPAPSPAGRRSPGGVVTSGR
jgi:beta-lactamase regulating signal transducer with metallopeptidase domain